MISQYENKLIADVLNVAHISKLPKKMNPTNFLWIEAVAKIKLNNGSYGFGIVKRNQDLSYTVTYINGDISSIMYLEEVYPYVTLDARHVKKFSDKDDAQGRIDYSKSLNMPYEIDFENTSIAHLNEEIVKAALYQQLNYQEE